jgi:hypothetical protein
MCFNAVVLEEVERRWEVEDKVDDEDEDEEDGGAAEDVGDFEGKATLQNKARSHCHVLRTMRGPYAFPNLTTHDCVREKWDSWSMS